MKKLEAALTDLNVPLHISVSIIFPSPEAQIDIARRL